MHKKTQITNSASEEKEVLLSALAYELFRKPLKLPSTFDWNAVFSESISQTVFPLVYSALCDRLPPEIKEKWETRFLQCFAANIRINAAHSEIHKLMQSSAIPYVILKGCASSRYYPKPELRTMGDVDFLVNPSDLERCTSLLVNHGMRRADDGTHGFHRTFSLRHITCELHWKALGIPLVGGETISSCFENIFSDMVYNDNGYYIPSDFHHGLILLLHTATHLTTTGIGLRHLCDWAIFIEKLPDTLFRESFEDVLKEIGLWELAKTLTAMSTRYLGASMRPWAADVDRGLTDSLMDDIWQGGNFGNKEPRRMGYKMLMQDSATRRVENRGLIATLAVAVNHKAKVYYPRISASYALLPGAWAAVCGRYSWLVLTKKRPWMKLGEDIKTIKRRKEFLNRLKLFEE